MVADDAEFAPQYVPADVGEFCGGYLTTAEWIWSALQERMPQGSRLELRRCQLRRGRLSEIPQRQRGRHR
jgi:hypothetical protein